MTETMLVADGPALARDDQALIDLAVGSVAPHPLEEGKRYAVAVPAGARVAVIDNGLDEFRDTPRRKTGTAVVHDAASFVAYLTKHGLPQTEVYADVPNARLLAVINAHSEVLLDGETAVGAGDAGWGDHRVRLDLRKTPAWLAWAAHDGKLMRQADFAEHVEDRLPDFVDPDGATMLEVAQSLQARNKVDFESSSFLANGQVSFEYRETIEAKAGQKGKLEIPRTFTLGLEVFEGAGTRDALAARLRYRISDSGLAIGYRLDRPEDVQRTAFLDILHVVENGIDKTVLRGTPG